MNAHYRVSVIPMSVLILRGQYSIFLYITLVAADNMVRHFKFDDYQGIKQILQDNGFRHDQEMVEAVLSRCTPTTPFGSLYTDQEILDNAAYAETHLSEQDFFFEIDVED